MTFFHILLIALIQGVTEFLPISSSAHLVLLPQLSGLQDQGNTIDVAAHVGTLGAVILYFWADVRFILAGVPRFLTGRLDTANSFMVFCFVLATLPVVALGLVFSITGLVDMLRSVLVIGWAMLGFGVLLYVIDQRAAQGKTLDDFTPKTALILGFWQAVALIPGTSRAGITITGARQMGFSRTQAARLSMLMSIPTIIASGTLASLDLIGGQVNWRDAGGVAVLSFLAALAALWVMMRLLRQNVSYTPYVLYRIGLGGLLLCLYYGGVLD